MAAPLEFRNGQATPMVSGLWAVCALPGEGPEYRFTGCPRRWRRWVQARRFRQRLADLHREMEARYARLVERGDR